MKRHLIYHSHIDTHNGRCISATIKLKDKNIRTKLERISRDGFTLSCDAHALKQILPNNSQIAPKNSVVLNTEFTLHSTMLVSSRIIYTRRTAKDNFLLELKFIDVSDYAMRQIDAFIDAKHKANIQPYQNSCVNLKRTDKKDSEKIDIKTYLNVA